MGKSGRARSTASHLCHKMNIFGAGDITCWFYDNSDDEQRRNIKPVYWGLPRQKQLSMAWINNQILHKTWCNHCFEVVNIHQVRLVELLLIRRKLVLDGVLSQQDMSNMSA